jgi:hypothetical protein
MGALEAAK